MNPPTPRKYGAAWSHAWQTTFWANAAAGSAQDASATRMCFIGRFSLRRPAPAVDQPYRERLRGSRENTPGPNKEGGNLRAEREPDAEAPPLKSLSLPGLGTRASPSTQEGNRLFPYSVGNGFSGTNSRPMLAEAGGQTTVNLSSAATPPGLTAMLGVT